MITNIWQKYTYRCSPINLATMLHPNATTLSSNGSDLLSDIYFKSLFIRLKTQESFLNQQAFNVPNLNKRRPAEKSNIMFYQNFRTNFVFFDLKQY